jgi:hypothetical protein
MQPVQGPGEIGVVIDRLILAIDHEDTPGRAVWNSTKIAI